MNSQILTMIIPILIAIVSSATTYFFTKKYELEKQWRQEKFNHYKELLSSLTDLAWNQKGKQENKNFALAVNAINLCGSQSVIEALMKFQNAIDGSKTLYDGTKQNELYSKLVFEIRKDLKLSKKDRKKPFETSLIIPATTNTLPSPKDRDGEKR